MELGDCIEWTGHRRPDGYGKLGTKYAHRLAYCKAHGLALKDIDGIVVRHKCDNPSCVRPSHLELGSQFDNVQDMMVRGRHKHNPQVLSKEQAQEIKERYVPRCKVNGNTALAKEFGVAKGTIHNVIHGINSY